MSRAVIQGHKRPRYIGAKGKMRISMKAGTGERGRQRWSTDESRDGAREGRLYQLQVLVPSGKFLLSLCIEQALLGQKVTPCTGGWGSSLNLALVLQGDTGWAPLPVTSSQTTLIPPEAPTRKALPARTPMGVPPHHIHPTASHRRS